MKVLRENIATYFSGLVEFKTIIKTRRLKILTRENPQRKLFLEREILSRVARCLLLLLLLLILFAPIDRHQIYFGCVIAELKIALGSSNFYSRTSRF